MGERIAHLVAGRKLDFLPLDEGFTCSPSELGARKRYGITVVS